MWWRFERDDVTLLGYDEGARTPGKVYGRYASEFYFWKMRLKNIDINPGVPQISNAQSTTDPREVHALAREFLSQRRLLSGVEFDYSDGFYSLSEYLDQNVIY